VTLLLPPAQKMSETMSPGDLTCSHENQLEILSSYLCLTVRGVFSRPVSLRSPWTFRTLAQCQPDSFRPDRPGTSWPALGEPSPSHRQGSQCNTIRRRRFPSMFVMYLISSNERFLHPKSSMRPLNRLLGNVFSNLSQTRYLRTYPKQ